MCSTTSLLITNSGDDASYCLSNILHLEVENRIPNVLALLLKVVRKLKFLSVFTKQNYIICVL